MRFHKGALVIKSPMFMRFHLCAIINDLPLISFDKYNDAFMTSSKRFDLGVILVEMPVSPRMPLSRKHSCETNEICCTFVDRHPTLLMLINSCR